MLILLLIISIVIVLKWTIVDGMDTYAWPKVGMSVIIDIMVFIICGPILGLILIAIFSGHYYYKLLTNKKEEKHEDIQ